MDARNLVRGSAAVMAVVLLGQVASWMATKLLFLHIAPGGCTDGSPNCIGLENLGTVATYWLIVSTVGSLGDLRLSSAYTRFIARGEDPSFLTGGYLFYRTVGLGIAGFVFAFVLQRNIEIAVVYAMVPLLEAPGAIFGAYHNALGRTAFSMIPTVVESVVRLGSVAFVAFHFTSSTVGPGFVLSMGSAYAVGASAGAISAGSIFAVSKWKGIGPLRKMFDFSAPLIGATLVMFATSSLALFSTEAILGPAQFQIYSTANAFSLLLTVLPSAIMVPLYADIASLSPERISKRVRDVFRYTTILLIPAVAAAVMFRVDLLVIFYSSAVVSGATTLAVLAVATVPYSFTRMMATVLTAAGFNRLELYISVYQLSVLSISLFFLLPRFGILGAAVSYLTASTVACGANAYYLHSKVQGHISLRPIAVCSVIAGAVFFGLTRTGQGLLGFSLDFSHPVILVASLAIAMLAYLFLLAVVGEITKQDVSRASRDLGFDLSFLSRLCWKEEAT